MKSSSFGWVVLLACASLPAGAAADRCAQLKDLKIPATRIGLPTTGAVVTSTTLIAASQWLPEYCKVMGSIKPVDAHAPSINFELDLPSAWNQKLMMFGGGGYDGVIPVTAGNVPAGPFDRPV